MTSQLGPNAESHLNTPEPEFAAPVSFARDRPATYVAQDDGRGNGDASRRRAVIVDVDNTLIDTAVRKHALLRKRGDCAGEITVDDVRSDYELARFLGSPGSDRHTSFFAELDTADVISAYPAPEVTGARKALNKLVDAGYEIIALTGRPPVLREATSRELMTAMLSPVISRLITVPEGVTSDSMAAAKSLLFADLQSQCDIVAVIGDRPSDVAAAHARGIPIILLNTTVSSAERVLLVDGDPELVAGVRGWSDVPGLVVAIDQGCEPMRGVRDAMSAQYAEWLAHLDGKANICVVVSGALSAISGQLLFSRLDGLRGQLGLLAMLETSLLLAAFSTAVLSLLYAIQAYTSRRTSGEHSGRPIRSVVKQWLGTLGGSSDWSRVPGDACDDLKKIRGASVMAQTNAHVRLLYRRYGTIDPDVVANLRMFELRAANYQKVYAERLASKLLRIGIVLIFFAIIVGIADVMTDIGDARGTDQSPPSILSTPNEATPNSRPATPSS